jgi:hypothetical protein
LLSLLASLNLPLAFNDRKPANYTLSRASSTGTIGYESTGPVNLDGVKMSGAAGAGLLFGFSTSTTAFTNNPNYIKDYLSVN